MVNGHDDVKAVAKHITEYTNDEEGVMRVRKQLNRNATTNIRNSALFFRKI